MNKKLIVYNCSDKFTFDECLSLVTQFLDYIDPGKWNIFTNLQSSYKFTIKFSSISFVFLKFKISNIDTIISIKINSSDFQFICVLYNPISHILISFIFHFLNLYSFLFFSGTHLPLYIMNPS